MKFKKSFLVLVMILCVDHVGYALQNSVLQKTVLQKKVIGARPVGFFSNFFAALNMLAWCDRKYFVPVMYWDQKFPYWQMDGYNNATNAWEYYFKPVSSCTYRKSDKIYSQYCAPDRLGLTYSSKKYFDILQHKHWGNKLINKYIKINAIVQGKIDMFVEQNFKGKKIIGIHLRGTDKDKEVKPVDPEKIFREANKYMGYSYFVATDEQRLLDLALKHLKGPVIYYDADRSISSLPLHKSGGNGKRGEDVLIEVMLFAKCDKFIHTSSNVSCAVLFFNPFLEHTMLLP